MGGNGEMGDGEKGGEMVKRRGSENFVGEKRRRKKNAGDCSSHFPLEENWKTPRGGEVRNGDSPV